MIREPFIYLENERRQTLSSCVYEPKGSLPPIDSFELWGTLLSQKKKGVLLLGSDALTQEDLPSFLRFAEKLGWPIFSDIISGGRGIGNHPCHIEHIELILKVFPEIQVDAILQIGNRIVSKTVQQWINNQKEVPYLLVADHPFRQDPLHKITRRMECSSKLFCDILIDKISLETDSWAPFWKKISNEVKEEISDHFLEKDLFSEPALFQFLKDFTSSFPFFLSSSMPIRDADLLFFPSDGTSSLFSNRGASGIDGNIATAAGISKGLQKPLVAVLGDLATLHDLNSFSLAAKSKNPILFVIINNQGGGIFSFLPVAEKKDLFEEFIATSHDYSFDSIAKTFSLNYECVDSLKDWGSAWDNAIHSKTSCIIECKTQRGSNVLHHHQLLNEVRKRLCSSTKHLEILRALLPYSSCMAF